MSCPSGSVDLDCDGELNREEVRKSSLFTGADTDGDGTLEKHELLEYVQGVGGESFNEDVEVLAGVTRALRTVACPPIECPATATPPAKSTVPKTGSGTARAQSITLSCCS